MPDVKRLWTSGCYFVKNWGGRQANCLLGDGWKYFNFIISDTIIVGRHRAAIGLAGVIAPPLFCDNTLENFLESLL